MPDCQFQPRLEAYHDGELPPEARRAVEQHLARCEMCTAELAWLRSVSQSLSLRHTPDLTRDQLSRLHRAIDTAAADQTTTPESYPISLYRAAAALAAIAASVLIVSCVWLNELPAGPARPTVTGPGPVAAAEVPAWERVAMTLRADPLPSGLDAEAHLADANLADWMLRGLGAAPQHNPQPNPTHP